MLTDRQRRLGELLRAELSDILMREVRDPGIHGLVTLTGVRVAADLSTALVFVSVYGEEEDARRTLAALDRTAPFMRALIRRRLDLRKIPQLLFRLDRTADRAQRIEQAIRDLHRHDTQRKNAVAASDVDRDQPDSYGTLPLDV
jgi:ribosome-binding factor A